MLRCAVKRTFQTSSFSSGLHVFKRDIKTPANPRYCGDKSKVKSRYLSLATYPVSPAPRRRDIQMTGALKWSLPPVCRNVCLSERQPVCALWAQLLLQFIPFFLKKNTLHMFRSWADLHVIWTFFIFSPRTADRNARTHIITWLNRQGDKHIHKQLVMWVHANDPKLRTLPLSHAPQYRFVFVCWNKQ